MSGIVERKQNTILEDIANGIPVEAPVGGLTVTPAPGSAAFPVAGTAAVGFVPSAPPLSVSGVDDAGLKRHLKTGTDGELAVTAGGYGTINSGAFNRPADTAAYSTGDLVANSTTAGSVIPIPIVVARKNAGSGRVIRARLMKSGLSLANAAFRIHLYRSLPTSSNGDNGAWITNKAVDYLGAFDVFMDRAFTDGALGAGTPLNGSVMTFVTGAGLRVVYALIEARAAYTPTSGESFTLTLEVDSD